MNFDVVLHLDSNDPAKLKMVLRNAHNYLKAKPSDNFQLDIVANGGGVVHLTDMNSDFCKDAEGLAALGVHFKVCANALAEHDIARDDIWPFCEIVPAGLVEVVRLQEAGFAYVKP